MNRIVSLFLLLGLAVPLHAAPQVSIAQLEDYLTSTRASKDSDDAIADNFVMESVDKVGQEKDINLIRFINYHKFASDARVISPDCRGACALEPS